MKFKTKNRVIEAVRFLGTNESRDELEKVFGNLGHSAVPMIMVHNAQIPTPIYRNDWVIKSDSGKIFILQNEDFLEQYEALMEGTKDATGQTSPQDNKL